MLLNVVYTVQNSKPFFTKIIINSVKKIQKHTSLRLETKFKTILHSDLKPPKQSLLEVSLQPFKRIPVVRKCQEITRLLLITMNQSNNTEKQMKMKNKKEEPPKLKQLELVAKNPIPP
uniref:Uncharacterized protein n=1 Tax=Cacopsylla melanoneura TaxID=428564 RepID=A0A8D9E6V9_9HEMI